MNEIAREITHPPGLAVWGGFFITIRDTEYPYKYVRSFANRGREPVGIHSSVAIHPWATSSVARSSVASLATRARPSERRSVRDDGTGSVRFVFLFSRRVRFCDGPTDGRSARSIEEGFKTRIVDQFILGFVLATDRFDPIRSDPTRSFASPVR